jgi:hypothetical protein
LDYYPYNDLPFVSAKTHKWTPWRQLFITRLRMIETKSHPRR